MLLNHTQRENGTLEILMTAEKTGLVGVPSVSVTSKNSFI